MIGTIKQGLLTFLRMYDTGDHFTLQREQHRRELEEVQRQTEELIDAMSECIYVMRYCPTKKAMEKLANEKDQLFYPLLSSQTRRENNKRKLDLLMESLVPVQKKKTMRLCHLCSTRKSVKCFLTPESQCSSCIYREQFPRRVKSKLSHS